MADQMASQKVHSKVWMMVVWTAYYLAVLWVVKLAVHLVSRLAVMLAHLLACLKVALLEKCWAVLKVCWKVALKASNLEVQRVSRMAAVMAEY